MAAPTLKYPMPMKQRPIAKSDNDGDEKPSSGKIMMKKSMGKSCPKR